MKKIKTIEIQIDDKTKKNFVVKELTVGQIIELTQTNKFFGANSEDAKEEKSQENKSFIDILSDLGISVNQVVKHSCDFSLSDLKELSPSEVQEVFDGWKEVNSSFLDLLEKMGVLQVVKGIAEKGFSDFLKTLAI